MSAKAMRFGRGHTDKYVYNRARGEWYRVSCGLNVPGMDRCTAPHTYPRGTKFDYNTTLTDDEALNAACIEQDRIQDAEDIDEMDDYWTYHGF